MFRKQTSQMPVVDNIDHFMGKATQVTLRSAEANLKAADQNLGAASQTITAAKDIKDKAEKFDQQNRSLTNIAEQLEERDRRSKWDWATLAAGMVVAAALAGGGAFFYAKANIEQDSFSQAITRISQNTDAGWCDIANGQIINGTDGSTHCVIHMPNHMVQEEPKAE